jgi:hypothetical protein
MASFTYDRNFMQAAMDELEPFLLSDALYWPLGLQAREGEAPYPRLTLGSLMIARQRLVTLSASSRDRAEALKLERALDTLRTRWLVRWQSKATREFSSRLRQWQNYLDEYRREPESQAVYYPYEVRWRVMLSLLAGDATGMPDAERQSLVGLDALVRAVHLPGVFLWETSLQLAFPQDEFWYLYGKLKAE